MKNIQPISSRIMRGGFLCQVILSAVFYVFLLLETEENKKYSSSCFYFTIKDCHISILPVLNFNVNLFFLRLYMIICYLCPPKNCFIEVKGKRRFVLNSPQKRIQFHLKYL